MQQKKKKKRWIKLLFCFLPQDIVILISKINIKLFLLTQKLINQHYVSVCKQGGKLCENLNKNIKKEILEIKLF